MKYSDWAKRSKLFMAVQFIILLLLVPVLRAQSTPSQFAGLLTNSTDYTVDAGVWTTPTVPAAGSCLYDETWKTSACRIPNPTDCPTNSTYNPEADCSFPMYTVDYSKTVPWSNDDAYYMAHDQSGWLYLYSVSGGTYTFVRRIKNASFLGVKDYGDAYGLYGDASNWNWANNAATPHLMYYTGSSATNSNRTLLKSYDADTNTAAVVHDFADTIASFSGCLAIRMMREGNQSDDDRYWAFACTGTGGDNDSKGVFTYDKQTDTVLAAKTLGAGGLCGESACPACSSYDPGTPNWVGMSPSGNHVVVQWNCGRHDTTWTRGHGTEIYDRSLNFEGVAFSSNNHSDVGYDVNGYEVFVANTDDLDVRAYGQLGICKLADLTATPGPTSAGGCQHTVALPGGLKWGLGNAAGMFLISMRGTHGAGQGWMLFSTGDDGTTSTGVGGYGTMENLAIRLDYDTAGTSIASPAATTVVRLGRNRAVHSQSSYSAQPNGVPNRNFTKFAYTSTWDVNPATLTYQPFYSMYTELSSLPSVGASIGGGAAIGGGVVVQ